MSSAVLMQPVGSGTDDSGIGTDSDDLRKIYGEAVEHLSEPVSSERRRILSELTKIGRQCSEPNWDGYNANPISAGAIEALEELVRQLPWNSPLPDDVVPEPSGGVGIEWYPHPGRSLIVSSNGHRELSYCLLVNGQQESNRIFLMNTVPLELSSVITRLYLAES
jgi:hypothetical protein